MEAIDGEVISFRLNDCGFGQSNNWELLGRILPGKSVGGGSGA